MSLTVLIILIVLCLVLMLLERAGAPTTLRLTFKGDVKRETAFLAQWGQSICTPLAALIAWQFDPTHWKPWAAILIAGTASSLLVYVVKRLLGRVRPNRERAGQFLGFSWRHENWRESFPSSHSACAIALTVVLAHLYPQAAATWWGLGITCATLRYVLDAHWPSDVIGGVAMGYAIAHETLRILQM
jgi:membrane-associated phospholipid phosphatase